MLRISKRAVLERPIGLLHATAMVAGIIIGASIFVQPSEINRQVPSAAAVLGVWTAAGVLTLFGALVCAELSSAFPRTGGVYVFLKETLSPACGFMWGWAMFWSIHSGIIAASAVIFSRYLALFVPLSDLGIRAVAITVIAILSAVNYAGVRQGSLLQTVLTSAKVLAIVLLLAIIFIFPAPARSPAPVENGVSFGAFILAVSAALFSFGGWHMVTYAAGEIRSPERTIPMSLLIGVAVVTACYVALNAAYLYLLPLDRAISSTRVAADAAMVLAGPRGAEVISILVMLSAIGGLNGLILAGPRVYYAMASDGLAFAWLAAVHPRYRTPYTSILIQAVWASFLVATATYRGLFTRVVYTEWLFFALMTAGLLILRRSPSYAPAFRPFGGSVVPVLFIAASVLVAFFQIRADPVQALSGLLLVALGLPVYYIWAHSRPAPTLVTNADHRLP